MPATANLGGSTAYQGSLGLQVIRHRQKPSLRDVPTRLWTQPTLLDLMRQALPLRRLSPEVNAWRRGNVPNFFAGLWKIAVARKLGVFHMYGALSIDVRRGDGPMVAYGLAGVKVITDVGVGFLVDAWQNIVEMENMKYHGLGTGSSAESAAETALVTELTTEYTGNVRATGSTTEGASANIFRTLGTNTLDGTPGAALREHGIFSASTAGVLWDRTLYAAITLSSGDSLASTYDATCSAGG